MRAFGTIAVCLSVAGVALAACSSGTDDDAPGDTGTPPAEAPAPEPAALFVLGDSLSDVGNAAAMADFLLGQEIHPPTVGLCNPADVLTESHACDELFYRRSRVSDGPVAVEHLATEVGVGGLMPSLHLVADRPFAGTNYAIASAKARGQNEEDLGSQVDLLLIDHASLSADALFVVMIGGNDAIDALQALAEEGDQEASVTIVSSAVAEIGDNIERLLDFGARRLVAANVPDLAMLPAVRAEAASSVNEQALLEAARSISETFNAELAARLDTIDGSERWQSPVPPVLVQFDLLGAIAAAREDARRDGHNVSDACFDSATYRQSTTATREFHPDCAPVGSDAPRFNQFLFWDDIHPTGATHAAIGAALIDTL